ncbi:malto-oligosyltrehalose synthase [Desertivibrio insolitus]|uniref:malto-oligosyltrehalose synthase n=1 Tax=Herbiconiux sp. SYSU D00978 TaxID=2812562 RepID=UPI001A968860|nr:malto-oligosyltrehalose synthase [Herbiconiux sp. SYSU D00978]
MSRIPISTYRLQVRESFDLFAAADVAEYIRDLGADWVYLSPLLTAEQGSDHGYDVTDHSQVDPTRGGAVGLETVADRAHLLGLGVLVDIVPNHMGVATPHQNGWWWDLLTHGRQSRYAEAFDVDWEFGGGKVRIPVLGSEDDLDKLEVVDGELRYYDNRFPLAPGTADDGADARTVHSRQNYELVHWRRADADLNYRRFFAVSTLAAIRVELPWVFEESHREIIRWVREGYVDGLRVDHPDGLFDPGQYLDDLAEATSDAYVLVEKILESGEQLPTAWATAGTTGYDALADVDRVLVDPKGRLALDALDARLRGRESAVDWAELIHGTKRAIADGILRSEVLRLERDFLREETGASESELPETPEESGELADALAELLACFPVYRSYLPLGEEHLDEAVRLATALRPELSGAINRLLPALKNPRTAVSQRFQQTSGMVMAKGVEDTAFYRYSRLTSLNEVGADPAEFAIGRAEFHSRQETRQALFPASLTTLSTHDTKRGEDVRARINVLAEIPDEWDATLSQLRERHPLGDGPFENLLWEAIVGAWPASRERLHAYAEKASREAGTSTTWTEPNEEFEGRMHALVDAVFDDEETSRIVADVVARVEQPGWSNSLAAKLIQLTAPGVPDVYQGSELWETSLVDPDNRRPVDFPLRRLYLQAVHDGAIPPIDETGAAKLLVTTKALRLRRDRPELFTRYAPLPAFGERAPHVIAFDRGGAYTVATRLPIGLERAGGWGDTTIILPRRPMRDALTGRTFEGGTIRLSDLLATYPVALLETVKR